MNAPFFPPDPANVVEARTAAIQARAPLINELKMLWRRRKSWVKAKVKLDLQAFAVCYAYVDGEDDKRRKKAQALLKKARTNPESQEEMAVYLTIVPLESAKGPLEDAIKQIDKQIAKLAKGLPGFEFAKATKGIGAAWYGGLVAEACGDDEEDGSPRDIASYENPSKLWKRMGLAPFKGKAVATLRSKKEIKTEEWLEIGYSPFRRSVMFVIGSGIIGSNTLGRGRRPLTGEDLSAYDWSPYEKLFVERCRYEIARDPMMARPETEDGKESYSKHAQARAKRYVEKRFLREVWKVWRAAGREEIIPLPQASSCAA